MIDVWSVNRQLLFAELVLFQTLSGRITGLIK